MKKKIFSILIGMGICFWVSGQTTDWDTSTSGQITYTGGKVGIGTTSPSEKLSLTGNIELYGNFGLKLNSNSSTDPYNSISFRQLGQAKWIMDYGTGSTQNLRFIKFDNGVGTTFMNFDYLNDEIEIPNTKVGIGTNSPISQFHVLSNSISLSQNDNFAENAVLEASDAGMGIYSDNGGNFGSRLVFGEISSGALSNKWGIIRSTGSQSKLYISYGTSVDVASNAKQLTVQHDGKIGIGTTSPAEKLEINGITLATNFRTTASPSYSQFIRNGTGAAVYVNQVSSNYPILRLSSGTASPNEGVKFTVENDGSVGIGTTSPDEKLHIKDGKMVISHASGSPNIQLIDDADGDAFILNHNRGQNRFYIQDKDGNKLFALKKSGEVGIGTDNPSDKLTVAGTIHSQEVKVTIDAGTGPDYVFEPDYNLLSLEEIEAFIQSEKHLPEIPSAKEMEANGVKLGEMNMLLLKKIEELTLHLIQQQKLNKDLIQRIEKLENK